MISSAHVGPLPPVQPAQLPVWSLAGNETWCMIGYHAMPVIADAYVKGFRRFDAEARLSGDARHRHAGPQRSSSEYAKCGYIPVETRTSKESVSRTLEYAYDDWCIAQMAKALGKKEDAKLFAKRAENYRNVFDPVGRLHARQARRRQVARAVRSASSSLAPTTPKARPGTTRGSCRTTCPSLIELIGGDEKFVAKLDQMFAEKSGVLGEHPRPDRADRPVRPRQRAVPPHRLPLQLRRRAVEDASNGSARS